MADNKIKIYGEFDSATAEGILADIKQIRNGTSKDELNNKLQDYVTSETFAALGTLLQGMAETVKSTQTDLTTLSGRVDTVEEKIPTQASKNNQLADKAYVDSTVKKEAGQNIKILEQYVDTQIDNVTFNTIPATDKGAAGGVATLDESGHVQSSQLPSYVDDVEEYATKDEFPAKGESGKIYLATETNLSYRWGGTEYVEIGTSIALGETSSTAYAGNKGKQNANDIAALKTRATNIENKNSTQDTDISGLKTRMTAVEDKDTEQDTAISNAASAASAAQTAANGKYSKPTTGIPKTDLASEVQASLDKADSAVQADDLKKYVTTDTEQTITGKKSFAGEDGVVVEPIADEETPVAVYKFDRITTGEKHGTVIDNPSHFLFPTNKRGEQTFAMLSDLTTAGGESVPFIILYTQDFENDINYATDGEYTLSSSGGDKVRYAIQGNQVPAIAVGNNAGYAVFTFDIYSETYVCDPYFVLVDNKPIAKKVEFNEYRFTVSASQNYKKEKYYYAFPIQGYEAEEKAGAIVSGIVANYYSEMPKQGDPIIYFGKTGVYYGKAFADYGTWGGSFQLDSLVYVQYDKAGGGTDIPTVEITLSKNFNKMESLSAEDSAKLSSAIEKSPALVKIRLLQSAYYLNNATDLIFQGIYNNAGPYQMLICNVKVVAPPLFDYFYNVSLVKIQDTWGAVQTYKLNNIPNIQMLYADKNTTSLYEYNEKKYLTFKELDSYFDKVYADEDFNPRSIIIYPRNDDTEWFLGNYLKSNYVQVKGRDYNGTSMALLMKDNFVEADIPEELELDIIVFAGDKFGEGSSYSDTSGYVHINFDVINNEITEVNKFVQQVQAEVSQTYRALNDRITLRKYEATLTGDTSSGYLAEIKDENILSTSYVKIYPATAADLAMLGNNPEKFVDSVYDGYCQFKVATKTKDTISVLYEIVEVFEDEPVTTL